MLVYELVELLYCTDKVLGLPESSWCKNEVLLFYLILNDGDWILGNNSGKYMQKTDTLGGGTGNIVFILSCGTYCSFLFPQSFSHNSWKRVAWNAPKVFMHKTQKIDRHLSIFLHRVRGALRKLFWTTNRVGVRICVFLAICFVSF